MWVRPIISVRRKKRRSGISSLLLVLSMAYAAQSGWTMEVVIPPGGPTRLGVPACPQHAVAVGFDAATGSLVCNTDFVGASQWIVNEQVDAPGAARFTAWPDFPNTGLFHRYTGT